MMKKLVLLLIFIASALSAESYNLDKSHSRVGFKIKHLAVSNVYGTFDKFDTIIEYDEKSKNITKLTATIDVDSINTRNKKRDAHLKEKTFFDVSKYPNIKFELVKILKDKIVANITMKNITKEIEFDYENYGTIKDPWGNERLGFYLEGKINRTDFGLEQSGLMETTSLVLSKTVKITADIQAKRAK
ncbi:YceI family protein [Campylobacterota bacterium DY0563]